MAGKMRIVVAASSYPSAEYFVRGICRENNVVGIIFEKRGKKESLFRLLRRFRKSIPRTADELVFHFLRRFLLGKGKILSKTDEMYIENIPKCYVKNINDIEARDFITGLNADILVVYGVNILKGETISILPKGVLNMHPGITPDYRGLDPLFWSIVNRDFGRIGTTIHFIDKGVDTGPVVIQKTIRPGPNDSYTTLFEKILKEGVNLMKNALTLVENGNVKTINRKSVSKLYRRPRISNYLAYKRGMNFLKKSGK